MSDRTIGVFCTGGEAPQPGQSATFESANTQPISGQTCSEKLTPTGILKRQGEWPLHNDAAWIRAPGGIGLEHQNQWPTPSDNIKQRNVKLNLQHACLNEWCAHARVSTAPLPFATSPSCANYHGDFMSKTTERERAPSKC